jgi:hypothetical protein
MPARDLWPVRHLSVDSTASPEEIARRIHAVLYDDLPRWSGSVASDAFELRRKIDYRNTFLATVNGRILGTPTGSRVVATLRMHGFAEVFACVWLAFVLVWGVVWAVLTVRSGRYAEALFAVPMPVLGVRMFTRGFLPEARRAEAFLRGLVKEDPRHVLSDCRAAGAGNGR